MTKLELEVAQLLHHAATRSNTLAGKLEKRDPDDVDATTLALDRLSATARYAFLMLTSKRVDEVDFIELNTEHPALWTVG